MPKIIVKSTPNKKDLLAEVSKEHRNPTKMDYLIEATKEEQVPKKEKLPRDFRMKMLTYQGQMNDMIRKTVRNSQTVVRPALVGPRGKVIKPAKYARGINPTGILELTPIPSVLHFQQGGKRCVSKTKTGKRCRKSVKHGKRCSVHRK